MRFAILVVAAVGAGAVSVGAFRDMVPAVRALGGDPAKFTLPNLNPVAAYEEVKKWITSGEIGAPINIGSSTSFPPVRFDQKSLKPFDIKIDPGIQRAISSGINTRIQQDIRRAQDISAYGRNPMAWHGAPPH